MNLKIKEKQNLPEQIDMNIKKARLEGYYNVKRKLNHMETTVEAIPYWKSFLSVISFMLMILLVLTISIITIINYESLPRLIPLIYSQSASTWTLTDKDIFLIVPILLLLVVAIIIRLNSKVFKFDRRLSIIVNLGLTLTAILGFIAFLQLFSFVLIY